MKTIDIGTPVGYAVSAVTMVFGIIVVAGYIIPPHVPDQFRYMFGVVLVLMGVYRFVLTRTKLRQDREREGDA